MPPEIVTRFAPSPTGLLHLGTAYAALFAWKKARDAGGKFLLRIEDTDAGRARPEFAAAIVEDLDWLGLDWDGPIRRQSEHLDDYRAALVRLSDAGLIYPCFCSRAEIQGEIDRAGLAPHGIEGPIYPGTCRSRSAEERRTRIAAGESHALRLDSGRAAARVGRLEWEDAEAGRVVADPSVHGDVVLAGKDRPTAYHLAVIVDDAIQGVTLVTRGKDLFAATHVHRLLQGLLGLTPPRYWHHRLLTDASGRRFAKRDRDLTLRALREAGRTPAEVREMTGFA